jgi:hypothetical protein
MYAHLKLGLRRFSCAPALLLFSVNAFALNISPSPSYDGNYTVTWDAGCFYTGYGYPYPDYVCRYLTENGVYVSDSSPYYATGRAEGTYQYDVYEEWYYFQQYVDAGSVIVGTPPPRDPIPTQMTYQYQTRQGDINSDGRVDLFVERTSGGAAGNGVIDKLVLWQSPSGSFWPVVDSYYTSIASSWPPSSATTVVNDFNIDGYVDVEVKGVAAATGAGVPYNQIVFSPGAPLQTQPLGVRPVDYSLTSFISNSLDYFYNPNYFYNNANYGYFYGYYYYYYCSFYPYYYGTIESYYYGGWGCGIYYDYFYGYYVDYSGFSEQAVSLWTNDKTREAGGNEETATQNSQQAAEDVIDVPIGGWPMEEELGANGEHNYPNLRRALETIWSIIGIGRANAEEAQPAEAPFQGPRLPNTVYLTGHPVASGSSRHAALEFIAVGNPYETISAFNSNEGERLGWLISDVNWKYDAPHRNMTYGVITPPGQTTAWSYWILALAAYTNYNDNPGVPYDAIGALGYNSNGYIRGLLDVTGGQSSVPIDTSHGFVAGSVVVPAGSFQ